MDNIKRNIHVYPDKEKLITATAEKVIDSIGDAIHGKGLCNLALAGGNTPRGVYSIMAAGHHRDSVKWDRLHLFWGDERMVPPDHQDSNFRMVQETLLEHVKIPDGNVHRIRGEIAPERAAEEYAGLLHDHFGEDLPRFDIILLGLGEDGHTASLFPDTGAVEERERSAVSVFVPGLNTWRVTLTLPVLNAAREIFFLVSGRSKSAIVQRIMSIKQSTNELPATMVSLSNGTIHWMLDSEAIEGNL